MRFDARSGAPVAVANTGAVSPLYVSPAMLEQPAGHGGRQRNVAARVSRLQPLPLPLVVLLPHQDPGPLSQLYVLPCEPDGLGDPQPGVREQLEEQRPLVRQRGEEQPEFLPWDYRGIAFHAFRHTCASLLFEEGRNVKQVQTWLGQADPGFTLRTYVHLMDEGVGDAAFLDDLGQHPTRKQPKRREADPALQTAST